MDRNRIDRESGERDRLFVKTGKPFGRNPGAKSYIEKRFLGFYWAVGHLANFIIQCSGNLLSLYLTSFDTVPYIVL
jgi:hypothetical protein